MKYESKIMCVELFDIKKVQKTFVGVQVNFNQWKNKTVQNKNKR